MLLQLHMLDSRETESQVGSHLTGIVMAQSACLLWDEHYNMTAKDGRRSLRAVKCLTDCSYTHAHAYMLSLKPLSGLTGICY